MNKTKTNPNIGMIGAVIGASIALAFLNKDKRGKINDTLEDTVHDLKKHAIDAWEDFKKKGDSYLQDTVGPPQDKIK